MSTIEASQTRLRGGRWAVRGGALPIVAPLVLLGLAHGIFLVLHGAQLWSRPHYQFFPMLLAGVVYLAWSALRGAGPLHPGGRVGSLALIVLSWVLLAIAILFVSPWVGAISALVTLLAVIHGLGGLPLLGRLLPTWLLLWLAIPPPLSLDSRFIVLLQSWASRMSDMSLDVLGVFHYMEGNVVFVEGRSYLVEEACSGVRSLFLVLSCVLVYAVWARVSILRTILLVVAAVAWIVLANVARIVTVAYAGTEWHINVGEGWRHETLGGVAFCLALFLLYSTDRLLRFLGGTIGAWLAKGVGRWFRWAAPSRMTDGLRSLPSLGRVGRSSAPEEAEHPVESSDVALPSLPELRRTWLSSWAVLGIYGALAIVQVYMLAIVLPQGLFPSSQFEKSFDGLHEELLPAHRGPFHRRDFKVVHRERNDQFGDFSRTWSYRGDAADAVVSVDYPFQWGWHEVSWCYVGRGWQMEQREILGASSEDAEGMGAVVQSKFTNAQGRYGTLFFSLYGLEGGALEPMPNLNEFASLKHRMAAKIWGNQNPLLRQMFQPCYQVQMFLESDAPLTPSQVKEARAFFEEARKVVHRAGPGGRGASS